VPFWRAGKPADSLDSFATYGPATGATLFPIELLAVGLLGVVTTDAVRNREPGRLAWATALAGMSATVGLLPIYFLSANRALLDRTVAADRVADALASWSHWNWLRTGLAVLAVAAGCVGFRGGAQS
jgi:hypothetical protein